MNPAWIDQELYEEYKTMFKDKQEAFHFIATSCEYYEAVDDMVDEINQTNHVRKLTSLSSIYYNHPYYRKWQSTLYPIDRITHCQYFDSVEWEASSEKWKRDHAKVLSHPAVNMVFIVILIEFGQETLDKFSSKFREHAHKLHLKDTLE